MATPFRQPKSENLTFRISPSDKALLESAVTHIGGDLTSFVLAPALERARSISEHEEATFLTGPARERFVSLMERPPVPSERFIRNLSDKRNQIIEE
jgi:uncharacterized protein (DUF1778 family)